MTVVFNDAVMVDSASGVDDNMMTDLGINIDGGICHNNSAGSNNNVSAYLG